MKVLVARTDKLGDVVLSLPAIAYVKERRPDWTVHVLAAPAAVPLLENDPHLDAIWTWEKRRSAGLVRKLAAERYDAAVLLVYDRDVAVALRRAGVRRRFGPLSKPSSWFLLNRGSWQRRSRSGRHEMEYNLDLAARLAGGGGPRREPRLVLSEGQREIGRRFRDTEAAGAERVVFVHPGCGGSALNWRPDHYAAAAAALADRPDRRVFLTGGEQDAAELAAVRELAGPAVESLAGRYALRDFLGVLGAGDLMIGPSTGPLHMAAALGLAVVGVYSPVPVQSPGRWGPRGGRSAALVPDVRCPARLVCFRERCAHWNCMERIAVKAVVARAEAALDRDADGPGGAVAVPGS